MTCYPCPKQDRAWALEVDSQRRVDAAWERMRLVYLEAVAAGVDVGDESMRSHFTEQFVHHERDARVSDALASFHSWVLTNAHVIDDAVTAGNIDPAKAWVTFSKALHKRWPRHPAADVSMSDCREAAHKRLNKVIEDCPPPDDPDDPYGAPPLLGVEWSEQVTGQRVAP